MNQITMLMGGRKEVIGNMKSLEQTVVNLSLEVGLLHSIYYGNAN